MAFHVGRVGTRPLAAVLALLGIGGIALVAATAGATQSRDGSGRRGGFEVWLADQSDTRPGFGGQLLIYEGADLMGDHAGRDADRAARSRRRDRGSLPRRDRAAIPCGRT